MTPDRVFHEYVMAFYEVFGRECFRQEPVTAEEWRKLKDKFDLVFYAHAPEQAKGANG